MAENANPMRLPAEQTDAECDPLGCSTTYSFGPDRSRWVPPKGYWVQGKRVGVEAPVWCELLQPERLEYSAERESGPWIPTVREVVERRVPGDGEDGACAATLEVITLEGAPFLALEFRFAKGDALRLLLPPAAEKWAGAIRRRLWLEAADGEWVLELRLPPYCRRVASDFSVRATAWLEESWSAPRSLWS